MYITISKALDIAVEAIKNLPDTYENRQAIIRLTNLKSTKITTTWTQDGVFKALNNWSKRHHRNPTVTDLVEPDMPKATTIKKLFDMRASAFLNIYYPNSAKKKPTTPYSIKTREEWILIFQHEFSRINPKSGKEYDAKRDRTQPTWETIARNLNVANWKELIELCNIDISKLRSVKTITSVHVVKS